MEQKRINLEKENIIYNGIYAIYDTVAKSFSAPIAAPNDRTAWRIYLGILDKVIMKKDVSLYRLCTMCITAKPDDDNIVQLEVKPVLVDFSAEKDEVKA